MNDSFDYVQFNCLRLKMISGVRSYNPWVWFVLPIWCLIFLVLFPPHQFDVAISRLFWIDGRWPWHGNVFLSEVLHKGVKSIPIAVALYALYQIVYSRIKKTDSIGSEKFKRYGYIFLAMLTSVVLCWWLKQTTAVSCPWDTVQFGGADSITDPGWSLVARAGNCWPGGHAGTGFCLFALFFAFRDLDKGRSRWLLAAVFIFGLICGGVRIMQGAHFFSHNAATMLIDWVVCASLYVLLFDGKNFVKRFILVKPAGQHGQTLIGTAIFWTVFLNIPFWRALIVSAGNDPDLIFQTLMMGAALSVSFFFVALAVIELLSVLPKRVFQLSILVLALSGVTALVGSLLYGTTMTPDMVRNFLQTDSREVSMYFSFSSVFIFLFLFTPAVLLLWTGRGSCNLTIERLKRLGLFALFLFVGILMLVTQFQPFSALMRNDKSMRYMIAPFNVVYSTASTLLRDQNTDGRRIRAIVDSNPRALTSPNRATVFVLVIGETARSANWQLAGYNRETNPKLRNLDIINIPAVEACGTSTDVSLPCMLSRIGRRDYDRSRILSEEALPSLLQRSGFSVTWIDNQSGSKGTSDGVRTLRLSDNKELCKGGECMDMAFVEDLKVRLSKVKPGERQVLILHMMGSHGPSYDKRSEAEDKVFGNVCKDPSFRSCSPAEIINAYDSSIRYTDRVLAGLIQELKSRSDLDTAFVYVSDHGESLGENGLFLHGAPYQLSPDVQRIVPMVMWLSEGFKKDYKVSERQLNSISKVPVTHDHLYHSVLGLLNVKSSTYEPRWDLFASKDN